MYFWIQLALADTSAKQNVSIYRHKKLIYFMFMPLHPLKMLIAMRHFLPAYTPTC